MSEELKYLNSVPEGYDKPRCEFLFQDRESPDCYCGLPDWEDSTAGEPRCEFHSEVKPDDLKARLEQAVVVKANLMEANLSGAQLSGADLSGAKLWGADLSGAQLWGADLSEADLSYTDLSEAKLGLANLSGAKLVFANLSGAMLLDANLSGAHLYNANLSGAHLYNANLSSADLANTNLHMACLGEVDLSGTNLLEAQMQGVNLNNANLSGTKLSCADLQDADLTLATIGRSYKLPGKPADRDITSAVADLREADLRGTKLPYVAIDPNTKLAGAKFGTVAGGKEEDKLRDEVEASTADEWSACADVYRQLKLAFQQQGDYERAGNFFYRERHCQRMALVKEGGHHGKRFWECLFEWVAGYGEQPLLVLGWAVVLILFFGLLQASFGLTLSDKVPPNWFTPLYHSCITFATVGYGDAIPSGWPGQVAAASEAGLGIILTSLFMICLVRKFSR